MWIKISPLRRLPAASAKIVPDDYNPLVDNWDDALAQFKARAKNDVLHRTIKSDWRAYTSEYTGAATIAHALRLALGDDAFKERSAPVVVHLAGFASWREDMGMRHDAYFMKTRDSPSSSRPRIAARTRSPGGSSRPARAA